MRLAILFWFYKDVEVCKNRLQIIRKYNPTLKIFGLFGGDLTKANSFDKKLSPFLDDFFAFTGNQDPSWKWKNGDLMINHWFKERGHHLEWDSIIIVQADMVVIGNIPNLFKHLKAGAILLSSIRPVKDVETWWYWIKEHRQLYDDFYHYLVNEMGYNQEPICCQYVIVGLPRVFLEQYCKIKNPELGFIEYRVPMYAQLFNIPLNVNPNPKLNCWWATDPAMSEVPLSERVLVADKYELPLSRILSNLNKKEGGRIFHPFDQFFPNNFKSATKYIYRMVKDSFN